MSQTKIGVVAAQMMEGIQNDFPEGTEIEEVILLASVKSRDGASAVVMKLSPDIPQYQAVGMLVTAQNTVMNLPTMTGEK